MDSRKFDQLVLRMAITRDRRAVLRAILAVALTRVGWRSVSAQEGCPTVCGEDEVCVSGVCFLPCANDRDCRSKKKDDPCLSKTCVDGVCVEAIVDCLPGYECCDEGCCPVECSLDADCAVIDPCRWGTCGPDGFCVFTELDPCLTCETAADCVNGGPESVCCEGTCQRPCPSGTVMGKGCECHADSSAERDGLVVRDDASGSEGDNSRQRSPVSPAGR